jgi:hypothetical protein
MHERAVMRSRLIRLLLVVFLIAAALAVRGTPTADPGGALADQLCVSMGWRGGTMRICMPLPYSDLQDVT